MFFLGNDKPLGEASESRVWWIENWFPVSISTEISSISIGFFLLNNLPFTGAHPYLEHQHGVGINVSHIFPDVLPLGFLCHRPRLPEPAPPALSTHVPWSTQLKAADPDWHLGV